MLDLVEILRPGLAGRQLQNGAGYKKLHTIGTVNSSPDGDPA